MSTCRRTCQIIESCKKKSFFFVAVSKGRCPALGAKCHGSGRDWYFGGVRCTNSRLWNFESLIMCLSIHTCGRSNEGLMWCLMNSSPLTKGIVLLDWFVLCFIPMFSITVSLMKLRCQLSSQIFELCDYVSHRYLLLICFIAIFVFCRFTPWRHAYQHTPYS